MVPDLLLPLPLANGTAGALVARDVPAAVFFFEWPGPDANLESAELWRERLLSRVVLDPRVTIETLLYLGDGRWPAIAAYLHAIGWPMPAPPDLAQVAPVAERILDVEPAWLTAPPHPTLARWLRAFAETWHASALDLWHGPASEFLWLLRTTAVLDERPPLAGAPGWTDEDGIGMDEA